MIETQSGLAKSHNITRMSVWRFPNSTPLTLDALSCLPVLELVACDGGEIDSIRDGDCLLRWAPRGDCSMLAWTRWYAIDLGVSENRVPFWGVPLRGVYSIWDIRGVPLFWEIPIWVLVYSREEIPDMHLVA